MLITKNMETLIKKFGNIVSDIENIKDVDLSKNYEDVFKEVWPFLKPLLQFLIDLKITNSKFDSTAGEIIVLGDDIYNGKSTDITVFGSKLEIIWEYIVLILKFIKLFTNDKTDAIIDKIIEIGNWIINSSKSLISPKIPS